jgi:hypothetical protein
MKFKVGDRVKVVSVDFQGHGKLSPRDIGDTGTVIDFKVFSNMPINVRLDHHGSFEWSFPEEALELAAKDIKGKPKPVLYAVFYEEDDVDPLKEFYSRKELNDWLKKASEDRSIRWESIRVIEKPKFLKVEVSKSFRLKA